MKPMESLMSRLEEMKLALNTCKEFKDQSFSPDDIKYLIDRVEKLEAALKWYADEKNYERGVVADGYSASMLFSPIETKRWTPAKIALKEVEE